MDIRKDGENIMSGALSSLNYFDDIFNEVIEVNYDDRKLILNDVITDDLIEWLCFSIINWNNEDKDIPVDKRRKITIYINSGGGDLIAGRFVLDIIKYSKTPVITVALAQCCSMASYILASGHIRYCFPNSILLYHDGTQGIYSTTNKAKDTMAFYEKLDDDMKKYMLSHSKMTEEFLDSISDREYYMFSSEMKELGIIDKIIGIDCDLDEIL